MKKISFICAIIFSFACAHAQLYVKWNGYVGLGTTDPQANFQIKSSTNNFTFKPSNSGSLEIGGYDGSTNSNITFWHSNAGFNSLIAKSYTRSSDIRLKDDIQVVAEPMRLLENIHGYSYLYKENGNQPNHREYGVIAQEVNDVLPELIDSAKGYMLVDYDQLIPILIEAVKQQQKTIDELQQALAGIDGQKTKSMQSVILDADDSQQLTLFQNAPNPFNTSTTIQCNVPESIQTAQLCIYNMDGVRVQCINITERGNVSVLVQAGTLAAGIYAYVLIGDGISTDTKQMVLTR